MSDITEALVADMYDVTDWEYDQHLEEPCRITCKYCGESDLHWHQACTGSGMTWVLFNEYDVQHRCIERQRRSLGLGSKMNPNIKIWGSRKV